MHAYRTNFLKCFKISRQITDKCISTSIKNINHFTRAMKAQSFTNYTRIFLLKENEQSHYYRAPEPFQALNLKFWQLLCLHSFYNDAGRTKKWLLSTAMFYIAKTELCNDSSVLTILTTVKCPKQNWNCFGNY